MDRVPAGSRRASAASTYLRRGVHVDSNPSHDLKPSLLRRPLAERAPSTEPQAKRQKADDRGETSNIATRVSTNFYRNLDGVLHDIDLAVTGAITELDLPEDAVERRHISVAPEKLALSTKILAFQSKAHDLVRNHYASDGNPQKTSTTTKAHAEKDHLVLSLYGNTAAGPKQLFSSIQQRYPAEGDDTSYVLSAREVALPSGMFTSNVSATDPKMAMDMKRGRTLGELFPSPPSLPTLDPPRPSKVATTRTP